MLLALFILPFFANAKDCFSWLDDLKVVTKQPPVLVENPNGGYAAIWEEVGEIPEIGQPARFYYYRLVNAEGEHIVSKKDITYWHVPSDGMRHFSVRYGTNSVAWLTADTLMIIGWRQLGHPEELERIIIDGSGKIVRQDLLAADESIGSRAVFVKTKEGMGYLVETGIGYDWRARIMQVYPQFGDVKKLAPTNDILRWFITQDNVVISTDTDELLFCCRLKTRTNTPIDEAPEGWAGMPNHLAYFLTDLEGNLTGEPERIDLTNDAFRRIPGIHLGGLYGNGAAYDLDLSHLPNGTIILSVTGLDDQDEFCVYQVQFTANGKIIKPNSLETAQTKAFPKDAVLPVSKVVTFQSASSGYAHFGFDEDGQFYTERHIWETDN